MYDYKLAFEITNKCAELQCVKDLDFKKFEDERITIALMKYVEGLRLAVVEKDRFTILINLAWLATVANEALAARCGEAPGKAASLLEMLTRDIAQTEKGK